ncbi:MAG: hypothetical protein WKF42_04410 [Solirubrobacteraceae bacterium]
MADEPTPGELPPRVVAVAYLLALVCLVAPLAVLGAAFAGVVLFGRGRRGAGAGVIALAVVCVALGVTVLR